MKLMHLSFKSVLDSSTGGGLDLEAFFEVADGLG
jgi:hypothetical protein